MGNDSKMCVASPKCLLHGLNILVFKRKTGFLSWIQFFIEKTEPFFSLGKLFKCEIQSAFHSQIATRFVSSKYRYLSLSCISVHDFFVGLKGIIS